MTIKYLFKAGCICEKKEHDVIFEFSSEEDFETYLEDKNKKQLLTMSVGLYFPQSETCKFTGEISTEIIECEQFHYSFDKFREYKKGDENNENEDDENSISCLLGAMNNENTKEKEDEEAQKLYKELITYRIYDDIERDIFVQFKNKNVYEKYQKNNFKEILSNMNKYFWEEYDYKQPESTILHSEVIPETTPHLYISE